MARLMLGLFTAALVKCAVGLSVSDALQQCGNAYYDPAEYTCYDGNFLCPVTNGVPTQRCGDACYNAYQYSCTDSSLNQLPSASTPIHLIATNPTQPFDGKPVEACSRHFWIGLGPCTYCPSPPVDQNTCNSFTNTTVLYPGSSLSTEVPGGQQYYIEPNGALGFTQAHSASYPPGSVFGVSAYRNGLFFPPNADNWLACPGGGSQAGAWQIFAKLSGITFPAECVGLYITTVEEKSGTIGAWQYI